jgi:carboxypeptidase Taq
MEDKLTKFRKLLGEISDLQSTGAVLGWDQQTYMPSGGAEGRAMQLATISRLAHEKFISDEIGMILEDLEPEAEALDYESDEACLVRQVSREYKKQCKVPSSWVAEFSRVTTLAQQAWQKAKAESDFPQFKPHLEEIVKLRRQYAGFFAPFDNVYDPLLDDFEPGMKTAEVKGVFDELRPQQTELVRAIADCGTAVDNSMLYREYPIQKQWDFGVEVIKKLGFDFERGRQDKSAHPFTTSFGLAMCA